MCLPLLPPLAHSLRFRPRSQPPHRPPARQGPLPPRPAIRAEKLPIGPEQARAGMAREFGLGVLPGYVLSRGHAVRLPTQTTAAASLDIGSESAFTALDSSLISALVNLS